MYESENATRRHFLSNSLAAVTSLGTGLLLSRNLFADRQKLATIVAENDAGHPLSPALKLVAESLDSLEKLVDYQATFIKSELIGRKMVNSRMELKLREKPFSVYLKFLSPSAGREVIYVQGQNSDYLQVHETGFASLAGTLSLDPKGSFAMEDNRYPVTNIGMKNMLAKLVETWLAGKNCTGLSVNIFPNVRIGDIGCKAIEVNIREMQPGAKFRTIRLYLSNEKNWPIRVQAFDFPGKKEKEAPLAEDYMYADVKGNIGLANIDFSTKNPKYRF